MRWLSLQAVIAIHRRQIAEHGGIDGIRDQGLLESALARPQNIEASGESSGVAELAAAYAYGIAKNHPFIDGNKRVALVALRTFLLLNGVDIAVSQEEKYLTMLSLADGTLTEKELAEWIEEKIINAE